MIQFWLLILYPYDRKYAERYAEIGPFIPLVPMHLIYYLLATNSWFLSGIRSSHKYRSHSTPPNSAPIHLILLRVEIFKLYYFLLNFEIIRIGDATRWTSVWGNSTLTWVAEPTSFWQRFCSIFAYFGCQKSDFYLHVLLFFESLIRALSFRFSDFCGWTRITCYWIQHKL